MRDGLFPVDEVSERIRNGEELLLAGDEAALRQLPRGNWIAGTIPYFMTSTGGVVDRERVFVNALPEGARCKSLRRYGERTIPTVFADLPASCFGVMIAPASSAVHLAYALQAPTFSCFAMRPVIGWISGVHLSDLGTRSAKTFDGTTGEALEQEAIVMQVELAPGKQARVGIVNIFTKGDGPAITFPENGFTAGQVEIDGAPRNLAAYIRETGLDTRLPLVADYCGLDVNVSFQSIDEARGEVRFYAPVFSHVQYRHARPISDYVSQFVSKIPQSLNGRVAFSCNCILNFLYSNLEGKRAGNVACPITFGEVAYQLLNQTLAYVTVVDSAR